MKIVTAKWIKENIKDINLIDVRTPKEFKAYHVEGSKNIPYPGILFNADHLLDKDKEYYLICHSGNRSGIATRNLEEAGYRVASVEGGLSSYK